MFPQKHRTDHTVIAAHQVRAPGTFLSHYQYTCLRKNCFYLLPFTLFTDKITVRIILMKAAVAAER